MSDRYFAPCFIMKIPNKRELQQIASIHSSDIDFKDFMKLYKEYTKESYSFLVNEKDFLLCHQIIHDDLGRTYYKISINEKIKTINNKIEQNKAQYNLDRQTAKISALSSGNVSKPGKDVLPKKDLLGKAATMKIFEYSPLGKELKTQTDITKKQYKKLDITSESDKITKKEKREFKKYNRSNLIYNSKYSFNTDYNIKNLKDMCPESKYQILL